ncbi:MAG: carotenoid oxygenase family protein [Verrucomicrobia subdivision 3 bacterium]|nr:carotenoid oxygenase family protein [Limisphaerales bacterium]
MSRPHLSGLLEPVRSEDDFELKVVGRIPDALDGTYYRNGPNPQVDPQVPYFVFFGDGMIHGFFLERGRFMNTRQICSRGQRVLARFNLNTCALAVLWLVQFGPTFSLLEPFDTQTALGIAEYQRASSLEATDPLMLGARFLNAQDLLNGVLASRVAELVFRVVVASQPGVRYAVVEDNQSLPDGTPLLAALQALNVASADDAINLIQPFNAARIARIQEVRTDTINGFCKGAGRTPQ